MKLRTLLTALVCLTLCVVFCVSCNQNRPPEPHAIDDPYYYVSPDGDDNNPGTEKAPFATIEAAKKAIRARGDDAPQIPITVRIMAGTYKIERCIDFGSKDGGTAEAPIVYEAFGGEVILTGAVTLNGSDFGPLTDEERARLHGDAVDKVLKLDLTKYGLTKNDWGELSVIGTYNTGNKYDDGITTPPWCELFINDQRHTLARYPNEGYLTTTSPIEEGDALMPVTKAPEYTDAEWWAMRNPKGDINGIDHETAVRAASWATLDGVWMFGYPRFDWADMSSPVTAIDPEGNSMSTKYVSIYGLKDASHYYFYNVFEELDAPGEWYLNRETGELYVYSNEDLTTAEISISMHSDCIIRTSEANYLTFRGITFTGTRNGSAVTMYGSNLKFENCVIKNVAGNAIEMVGTNNYIGGCEMYALGCGGIVLGGGDRATLTPSGTVVENNHIHHFGQITRTYSPALSVPGVGHVIRGNVIHDAPHMAIGFGGNDNIFEYNEIYRVCLEADDSGAIYGGKDFTAQGNTFRYNYFHDIYSIANPQAGVFAIYCDDAMGGSIIEHNVFQNCQGAQFFHGGHNMIFRENLIIDKTEHSACAVRFHAYAYPEDLYPGGQHEASLNAVPYTSDIWLERFPQVYEYTTWSIREQTYPHYCDISNNIIINHLSVDTNFTWDKDIRQNKIDNNLALDTTPESDLRKLCEEVLPTLLEGFDAIPFSQMGSNRTK